MPQIIVHRPKEFKVRMRAYKLKLNGEVCADLGMNETEVIEVASGTHQLEAKIDWASSGVHMIEVQPQQDVKIKVEANKESFYFFVMAIVSIVAYLFCELMYERAYFYLLLFAIPFFVFEAYYLTLGKKKYLRLTIE